MTKEKVMDTIATIAFIAFATGIVIGFYRQVEANRNLNHKIEILQKHNNKISEEVDKLHKTIKSVDAEIAKRLKETADKNHVGG